MNTEMITITRERYEELVNAEVRLRILKEICIHNEYSYLKQDALIILGCPEEE